MRTGGALPRLCDFSPPSAVILVQCHCEASAHTGCGNPSPIPSAPLPKGGWHGEAVTGGFRTAPLVTLRRGDPCGRPRAGKSPKRRRWRKKRGDFEEVPRLAATTVAGNRLAQRWAREPRPYAPSRTHCTGRTGSSAPTSNSVGADAYIVPPIAPLAKSMTHKFLRLLACLSATAYLFAKKTF